MTMEAIEEETGPEPIVPGVARALSPLVRRILALNPGARTGLGTNTYLIGIDEIVVIDPGPEDANHLDSVAGCGGDRIRWITWTQEGPEYTAGCEAMAARTGAVVLDPAAGDTILGTEFRINVHSMAGPSPAHRTFLLEEERMLICGGLMVDDGLAPLDPGVSDLDAVTASLEAASKMRLRRIAPVHGHIVEEAKKAIPAELEHRAEALAAVLGAVKSGAANAADVVAALHPAIEDEAELAVLEGTAEVHLAALAASKQAKNTKGAWKAA
jgi:glyoxylase-like metal-dependent hydrolase (beta-lactamase superfamily II)